MTHELQQSPTETLQHIKTLADPQERIPECNMLIELCNTWLSASRRIRMEALAEMLESGIGPSEVAHRTGLSASTVRLAGMLRRHGT